MCRRFWPVREGSREVISRGKTGAKNSIKVTVYSNGFTLNDGPFRDYKEEANKVFIQQLRAGKVPAELASKFKGDLEVDLEDKTYFSLTARSQAHHEEQKQPQPKPQSFTGQGKTLGGVLSQAMETKDLPPPAVDKGKEVTRVNVRLHTGKAVQVEINVDTKVQVLYDYIAR
eukprot:TRINITY_DN4757_c0_g1_i3.p1 TRINITY_DN4757_c0_g1~~TRINITY_DN4757_c0_g1_i3.p1  ORF type:complete len:172 (+),score=30.92 TRINITY_DN4757_c0_g1_i3:362-877(+)